MKLDLTRTIDDILTQEAATTDNPDFLLYLTGYARFFGTDYDPWCEYEYWSIPTINPFNYDPYLSKTLREAFNDRVGKVNDLYKSVAESDAYKSKVRYIDVDSRFSGHRFCEPGSNYKEQINTDTNFDKVYLWNLNYPWQITGQGAPSASAAAGNVTGEEAEAVLNGGEVTAWNSGGGNKPENGWRLRPFHPRFSGYTAIKNAIKDQLKVDGLPKVGSSTTPTTTTPAPAPSPTPTYDPNFPDCVTCGGDLGASDCKADDGQCLVDQCNADTACQKCHIDCSQYLNL